ncbi:MAG: hypothetical protein ACYC5O_15470 [Anaerolineae bacterium]
MDDRHVGVGRLRPAPLYSGVEEDGSCALAAAGGFVLRAWVDAAGDLRLCRTLVEAGSGWDAWVLLAQGASTQAQVAVAAGDGEAYVLWVTGDGAGLRCRRSTDGGASWAAEEQVHQAGAGCRIVSLTATTSPAHECICLLAEDGQGAGADDIVYVAWRQLGQWTAAAWPRDPGDGAAGLAAVLLAGDATYTGVYFALCGRFEDTTRPAVRLYYVQLTAGGQRQWLYRGPILVGDAADFAWSWPSLVAGTGDRPRLLLVENTAHGSRLGHLHLARLALVGVAAASDFTPLQWQAAQGAGAAVWDGTLFVGCAAWVLRSPVYSGAVGERLDASGDVVAYEGRSAYRGTAAGDDRLRLVLDNSDGKYDPAVSPALRLGGQVCLREGYRTATGEEVACQAPYWIEEIEHATRREPLPGGQVVLHCYGGWAKLWRSLSDRAREWACAPALLLAEALERFGFCYSDDGSASLYSNLTPPRFTLAVGQPWGGLVAKVLDYCGCELRFYVDAAEEEAGPSARAHVYRPGPASVYTFGPAGHPVSDASLSEREAGGTWVQVYGDGVSGEALDAAAMTALGYAATRQAYDLRLNAGTDVTAAMAAGFLSSRYARERAGGRLVVRPNVGLELLDVVSVQVGASVKERRVLAIERRYDRLRGVYEQRLLLGGV